MLKSMMVASVLGGVSLGVAGLAAEPDRTPAALPSWRQLADTPVGRMMSGNLGRLLVLRSEVNLTPEQRAEVRGVLVSHRSQIAATVKSVREKRLVLRDEVLAEQPDEGKIRAAASELGDALGDAAVKAAKLRGKLAPILTDEQRELIREFREDRDESIDEFLTKAIKDESKRHSDDELLRRREFRGRFRGPPVRSAPVVFGADPRPASGAGWR